jgi:ABC-type glycerol-3-phosphate transport system permease component
MTKIKDKITDVKPAKQKHYHVDEHGMRVIHNPFVLAYRWFKFRRIGRKSSRSMWGNVLMFIVLGLLALFMALPLVYTICLAFKPMGEILKFPPDFLVKSPTMQNFIDLGAAIGTSTISIWRYIFNSLFISVVGTVAHVLLASLAAYPLAKHKFPGRNFIFGMVVISLMFSSYVIQVPRYLEMSALHLLDNYLSIMLPLIASTLGLYLMKQFMEQIPDATLESARMDGANEWQTWFHIVMPMVKPAYLTLTLFAFLLFWNDAGQVAFYITSESKKTLPLALSYITSSGLARLGAAAVVGLLMMLPPILIFIVTQSNVIETMKSSGLKE